MGQWRAWLDSPGGRLPFGLEIQREGKAWRTRIVNGVERIDVPRTTWDGHQLVLIMDHYDSRVSATVDVGGKRLDGEWKKRASGGGWTVMPFHATLGVARRFDRGKAEASTTGRFDPSGRWSVAFSQSSDLSVAVFKRHAANLDTVTGTFMTTTGDYRYLAGNLDLNRLRLSVFDGAHAFLFDARLQGDGTLVGDFWSRDTWHEKWTARRDAEASLPDAFTLTTTTDSVDLGQLRFPDLEGKMTSLNDPAFAGKVRIIEIFGTWCPNCFDATKFLVELDSRYRDKGLRILGLAFELTGDFKRDAGQVRTYAKRQGVKYPILLAGVSDKPLASSALPFIDRVRSYPTTIFLDASNRIRAVYTGFSGPATGSTHDDLRREFVQIITKILNEPA